MCNALKRISALHLTVVGRMRRLPRIYLCLLILIAAYLFVILIEMFDLAPIHSSKWFTLSQTRRRIIETNQSVNYNPNTVIQTLNSSPTFHFKYLKVRGVYTFYNVCIEDLPKPVTHIDSRISESLSFTETKKIVLYNQPIRYDRNGVIYNRHRLSVAGSSATKWNKWLLHFVNSTIPETHTVLPTTAFFITETFPMNFYHFWEEEFIQLFSSIRATNRLHTGQHNQILIRNPRHSLLTNNSVELLHHQSPYDAMLHTLYTTKDIPIFYELPTNTCYSSAVFGMRFLGDRVRDSVDHVLRKFNMSYKHSVRRENMVILKRQNRNILNVHELVKAAESIGFKQVRVMDFEGMPVLEQLATIVDTDVLVGVQGAGLQWAIFMRPGSSLIEISWPRKYWKSYFKHVSNYSIRFHTLETNDVIVNWQSYEQNILQGRKCSPKERRQLMKNKPTSKSIHLSIWKYADVRIDAGQFSQILRKIVWTKPSKLTRPDHSNKINMIPT